MERVTKKELRGLVASINAYSKNTYRLDIAYGGYRLVKECENGGISDVSYRVPAREMMHILDAIYSFLVKEEYK